MNILLFIDIQYGFPSAKDLIAYTKGIDYTKYDKIIATQFINNETTLFYQNGYKEMLNNGIELYPIIKEKATDIIVKDTYGIPIAKLYDIVKKEDIENIDIIGVETDACVLATMFRLWDEKISFRLLKSKTSGMYGLAKLIMKRNFFIR